MSTVGEAIGEVNTRFHTTGTELEKTSKQFIQFATINGTNVTQSVDQVDKIMKAWNVDASQTFTSPENRSMYNSSSYKSIQTKKEDGIRKRVSSLYYNGFMNVLEFWQSTHPAKLLNS